MIELKDERVKESAEPVTNTYQQNFAVQKKFIMFLEVRKAYFASYKRR